MPGPRVNMQVVVKDSKKYAAIGGWGFGDFTEGKPADEAKHKTCFRCHEPAKDDWPRRVEQRLVGVRVELPRFESAAGREPRQGTDSQGEMPDTLSKATIQQVFAAIASPARQKVATAMASSTGRLGSSALSYQSSLRCHAFPPVLGGVFPNQPPPARVFRHGASSC